MAALILLRSYGPGMPLLTSLIIAVLIGLLPAVIANRKGHSFVSFWLFGAALFIVALPVALMIKPDVSTRRKCPHCAEHVAAEARVCKHCGRDLPAGAVAGWYPDPQLPGSQRWWDGKAWTAEVRTATDAAHD